MDNRDLSVGELIARLADDVKDLVRAEAAFAKAQLTHSIRALAAGGVLFAVAAALGLGAFLAATAFLIILLASIMPAAVAALVVAVAYGVIAAVFASAGIKKFRAFPAADLEAVAQNVKEDIEWTRMQAVSKMK